MVQTIHHVLLTRLSVNPSVWLSCMHKCMQYTALSYCAAHDGENEDIHHACYRLFGSRCTFYLPLQYVYWVHPSRELRALFGGVARSAPMTRRTCFRRRATPRSTDYGLFRSWLLLMFDLPFPTGVHELTA